SLTKANLQNAADAAALAGAYDLPNTSIAGSTAIYFAGLNGDGETETTIVSPYNGDPTKIQVICKSSVSYTFARALGLTTTDITAQAVAQKTSGLGEAFDYAVFSGSLTDSLTNNGSNLYIGGSVHSNCKLTIHGSDQTITGSAEAVSKFTFNGSNLEIGDICQASMFSTNGSSINIGTKITSPATVIDMPDFSDVIQDAAEEAGQAYSGNKIYNGSRISVDSPIYVNGNLTINGSNFEGTGIVLVSGDISFNGSNLMCSSDSAVCFYSANGDITINGSGAQLDGIVYAPNGTITMNGSNQTINGRVIGNEITFNGSGITIVSEAADLECLPEDSVKLVE
ncbi:MAG: hypothetical protein AB7C97_01060, partial [Oscillospiraceae bacterium]